MKQCRYTYANRALFRLALGIRETWDKREAFALVQERDYVKNADLWICRGLRKA